MPAQPSAPMRISTLPIVPSAVVLIGIGPRATVGSAVCVLSSTPTGSSTPDDRSVLMAMAGLGLHRPRGSLAPNGLFGIHPGSPPGHEPSPRAPIGLDHGRLKYRHHPVTPAFDHLPMH